jgi:hypothetical protein
MKRDNKNLITKNYINIEYLNYKQILLPCLG